MTTKKQDSSADKTIKKHKAIRRAVQPSPLQAFDIIPRHQVRPSTTSRPVIPSSQPEVADNTMTNASTPAVRLSHQVRIEPGTDKSAPETTDTQAIGVSVSDLLAKKNAAAANDMPVDITDDVPATVDSDAVSEPADDSKDD